MKKVVYIFSIIIVILTLFANIKVIDNNKYFGESLGNLEFVKAVASGAECNDCSESGLDLDCDSGGIGSKSCSVGDWLEQCSVTCYEPCYACCDAGKEECKCCGG